MMGFWILNLFGVTGRVIASNAAQVIDSCLCLNVPQCKVLQSSHYHHLPYFYSVKVGFQVHHTRSCYTVPV